MKNKSRIHALVLFSFSLITMFGCGQKVPAAQTKDPLPQISSESIENTPVIETAEDISKNTPSLENTEDISITDPIDQMNANDENSAPKTGETSLHPSKEEWEVISVLDAWGIWHDMKVNPYVTPHPYDWTKLTNDGQNITYNDSSYTIRKGVDVSHHQGSINWEKVSLDGIEFAILRIGFRSYGSSGSLNKDKQFEANFKGASDAGLDLGIYFFSQAITDEEAKAEAEYVLKLLDNRPLSLPVVYDPEILHDITARTDDMTKEQFTRNTIIFCDLLKEAGYDVMVYSNIVFEDIYFDMEQLKEYPIWYADYEKIPQSPYDFCFWQYSCEGKVNGISTPVDLNIQFVPVKNHAILNTTESLSSLKSY